MIKALIIDLDNTLFDFMKMKRAAVDTAVQAMIDAGFKMPPKKVLKKIYEVYDREGIEDQEVFNKVLLEELGHIDYKVLAAGIIGYRRAKEGTMILYPHVHLTLTSLAKMGIKMVIVSDAPRLPAWMRICSLELHHYFDHVLTYDDTGAKKPSPRPFQMAMEFLGVQPEETLMIGDWAERDMVGAKSLGIRTVFARYGDVFNTKDSGADYEINDIIELVEIVRRENEGQMGLFKK